MNNTSNSNLYYMLVEKGLEKMLKELSEPNKEK